MPGAVGRTSTYGLTNTTLPYVRTLASLGWNRAIREDSGIRTGANIVDGKVTYEGVAEAFGMEYTPIDTLL